MSADRCVAFAPGRVNLIGEHTDCNQGLALPFAIQEGVTVSARATPGARAAPGAQATPDARGAPGAQATPDARGAPATPGDRTIPGAPARIRAYARDFDERDELPAHDPPRGAGWRAFVRGVVAEMEHAGLTLPDAQIEIAGDVPRGAGLSSSAAMEVALCLALIGLCDRQQSLDLDRMQIAKLCARVENDWVGAQTGLLDQLACLYGEPDAALLIDFRSLAVQQVPLALGDWRLLVLDSGERHSHASSGYNERRSECARACELLGVSSLREADLGSVAALPEPLRRRATHVLAENERVRTAVRALAASDLPALGALLDAAHASLRDCYEVSTPAVEQTVLRMREAGAAGARLIGGGFGGSVLGLFAPGVQPPPGARQVQPGPGARLIAR